MSGIYPADMHHDPDLLDQEIAILRRTLVVKRITLYLVAVTLALGIGGGLWLGWRSNLTIAAIRQTQTQNSPIARDTHSLVQSFQDCVTPGGKCFERALRAQRRNNDTTDKRNREVSAAASACAITLSATGQVTYHQVLHCVQTTLVIGSHTQ